MQREVGFKSNCASCFGTISNFDPRTILKIERYQHLSINNIDQRLYNFLQT